MTPMVPAMPAPTMLEVQAIRLARATWPAPMLRPTMVRTAVQSPNRIGIMT